MSQSNVVEKPAERPELRLDLGCGKSKREGFIGLDQYAMEGVDAVTDFAAPGRWRIKEPTLNGVMLLAEEDGNGYSLPDNSVDEVHCSHFLEHLTGLQRVQFFNELYRVLIPDGKATIITPHWSSNRAYGDFTHQWPPVSEMLYYYVSREWREKEVPHCDVRWNPAGYSCNFAAQWGYGMHSEVAKRNTEYQQYAMAWYKEACQDLHATLVAKKGA